MIPSVYRISLDVHDAHSSVCLDMKRQDTARQISIALTDGGFPYKISEECYAIFTATKADGHIIAHPCEIKGNIILYDVHAQTTAAVGLAECEIKLYGADDKLITSPGFNILVSSTSYTEGDIIESEDHVTVLGHLISEATTVITEGKAVNAEARALIDDMEAKRDTLDQQIADTKEYAEIANRASADAGLARDRAEGAANLAVSNARRAETAAANATTSENNAKASAQTAVNMANAALAEKKAAEAAADRAEAAASGGGSGVDANTLQAAINAALAQAKASGEFDGEDGTPGKDGQDGYTPQKGIDYFDGKDGQPGKDGVDGKDGAPGKSAYQYAKDGGYTGTEEEFSKMLAQSTGTSGLPLPPAAAVGQFIVVSAVDESGKVTATEAVDAPTLPDAEGVAF